MATISHKDTVTEYFGVPSIEVSHMKRMEWAFGGEGGAVKVESGRKV